LNDLEDDPFGDDSYQLTPAEKKPPPERKSRSISHKNEGVFRAKTKELLCSRGYVAYEVATWKFFFVCGQSQTSRSDLFGIFDMEAYKGLETIGVQYCAVSGMGAHLTKMISGTPVSKSDPTSRLQYLNTWLRSGRKALLIGWEQEGGKGSKWKSRERWIDLDEIEAALAKRERRLAKAALRMAKSG